MKIVDPSAEIIEKELAGLSVCQRIDRCASVCYQRPPRPTEEEAEQFCRNLIERGHLPALEFATIHLAMPFWESLEWREEKYLHNGLVLDSREEWVGWWSYTRGSVTQEKLDDWQTPTHWAPWNGPKEGWR